jgi:hypothetical protein
MKLSFCQDFYLDLVENNRKITPRDYLEIALRPLEGRGKDLSSKNEVSVIIYSYCFTVHMVASEFTKSNRMHFCIFLCLVINLAYNANCLCTLF